ncbi:unnamed protein product, partial [Prunus brigantina]
MDNCSVETHIIQMAPLAVQIALKKRAKHALLFEQQAQLSKWRSYQQCGHLLLRRILFSFSLKSLEEAAVLHYTYARFSDLTSRRDRCGCKPTKEDVKRCFMLEFDRSAFIVASTATKDEMLKWYHEHIVWDDKDIKLKLLRKGILTRIYAPMV